VKETEQVYGYVDLLVADILGGVANNKETSFTLKLKSDKL